MSLFLIVAVSREVAAQPAAPSQNTAAAVLDTSEGISAAPDQARGWQREPGVEDEDVALAVPRAVLFVPKLVFQVVLWPIDQGVALVDDAHLLDYLEDLLYFDDEHKFGWSPTLAFNSATGPTIGAKLFHNSLFGHDEHAQLRASYFGRYVQFYELAFEADRLNGSRTWLEFRGRWESESGSLFGGIGIVNNDREGANVGPRESNRRSYFAQDRGLGLVRVGYTAGETGSLVKMGVTGIFNHRTFARNTLDKVRTETVYDTALIPGFDATVKTVELQANLVVDLRASQGLDSRGAYLETFGGRVPKFFDYAYWHYGGEFSYTIDLYKATRLLTLRTALEGVAGKASAIPFSDLPRLGGADRLRGYEENRFRDYRAALGSIEYHYPIHANIMGELFFDAGYVSDRFRHLYDLSRWKVGYGGGLIFGGRDSVLFRVDVAYGDGLQVQLTGGIPAAFDGRSTQL